MTGLPSRYRLFCFLFLCVYVQTNADGLPGEYIIAVPWREAIALHSPFTNPALIAEENYLSLRANQAFLALNTFQLSEVGITLPFGLYQSFGLSYVGLGSGTVDEMAWTDTTTLSMGPTGRKLSDRPDFFALSYATNIWNNLSAGANLNFVHRNNFGTSKMGIGLDLGATWRLLTHPVAGVHRVGLTIQNLVPPNAGDGAYARDCKLLWYADFFERRIDASVSFDIKDFLASAEEFKTANPSSPDELIAAAKKIETSYSARMGFWLLRMFNIYGLFGTDFWGLSGGINLPAANGGRSFTFLYQYMSRIQTENFSTHSFAMRVDFGRNREELFAKKSARMFDLSPANLYIRAMTLYREKKFWDAYFVFGQLSALYPDFFKADYVKYYMGSCLEMLDMREAAVEAYNQTKIQYSQSTVIPLVNMGQMRVFYRMGNTGGVSSIFPKMNAAGISDTLRYQAYYLMAQTAIVLQNQVQARELFEAIPDDHPDYAFAQHSLALIYLSMGNTKSAVGCLQNSAEAKAITPAQKEIVNRSRVFLGYVLYQENIFEKALPFLKLVPASSIYFEDAQLGVGWCQLKMERLDECRDAGENLLRISREPVVRCEGALLMAYANILQKKAGEALAVIKHVGPDMLTLDTLSNDTLLLRRHDYTDTRSLYNELAKQASELAVSVRSEFAAGKIDSLGSEQKTLKRSIDDYLIFNDAFARKTVFMKNGKTVKGNLDYCNVVADHMLSANSGQKVINDAQDKQKEIDKKIEELQQELQKMNDGTKK